MELAILDLSLSGLFSFPVADILRQRGIQFIFATGYGSQGITDNYRHEVVLVKPYRVHELEEAINNLDAITPVL